MMMMMKKKVTIAPADEWLNGVIHRSAEFQALVEAELAAIDIAQDLVALREARGLSQRQLAKQLGVTQSAIAQLESSRSKNVELRTLVRAAAALGGRVHVSIRSASAGRPGAARRAKRQPAHATHHSRP